MRGAHPSRGPNIRMLELKPLLPKPDRPLLGAPGSAEPKQRRMMVIALTLLLVALGFVLYHDRDFWFPDTQEAQQPETQQPEAQPAQTETAATGPAPLAVLETTARTSPPSSKSRARHSATAKPKAKDTAAPATSPADAPPVTAITERTVLPPLEVEVVAGDSHRTVHPATNSVRVDLQPGTPPQADAPIASPATDTAASLTSNAAEHVQMSADASEIVTHPVKPGYPLLARQMKVQGSVILQALISRDGAIQDLHVMSGPPILAGAAREAVRQWRFKPHYLGAETVETQAKITVNFTISTN
jgi:TonB family protein